MRTAALFLRITVVENPKEFRKEPVIMEKMEVPEGVQGPLHNNPARLSPVRVDQHRSQKEVLGFKIGQELGHRDLYDYASRHH